MLRVGGRDRGVAGVNGSNFECILTDEKWRELADLVFPFADDEAMSAEPGSKHQWLDETGDVSLLLSPSGTW
jgi:hypothetical protein